MITKLAYRAKHNFDVENITKYETLSAESKNDKTATVFWEKKLPGIQSIYMMIIWGLPTAIGLFATLCSVLWTFIQKNLFIELTVILALCAFLYFTFIRSKQNMFTISDKKIKKEVQKIRSKIQLDLIPFQHKEYDAKHIIGQCQQISTKHELLEDEWEQIGAFTNTGNQLLSVMISYFVSDDIPSFMLIMMTMNNLSNAISNATQFLTQYNRLKNDFDTLQEFWSDAEFKTEPIKLYPCDDLVVEQVKIERGDGAFKMQTNFPISLANGQKIYIAGASGSGKSTFVQAILGLIDGASTNIGKPENYYHFVADYFQGMGSAMPSSNISLRDYFKGEPNDNVIDKYLHRVFSNVELTRIKRTLLTQDETITNAYDAEINEKISGGQKSRLILTLRGYEADCKNKGIIVLDEPCPDVDHDTYTEVMNTFFQAYHHCTIIMIGHLCECKKKSLRINWTQEFQVHDGIVSRIYH